MDHVQVWRRTGVMQGRLTDKGGFYPQQFPWKEWEQEFYIAGEYGLDCIEWMFNAEYFEDNPIWTRDGREKICTVMGNTGIKVRSICANYFMQYALNCEKSLDVFERLLDVGEELWTEHIVLPLFGSSAITEGSELAAIYEWIEGRMTGREIKVCFESDLLIDDQVRLCTEIPSARVGICYDVGNAAGNGYDCVGDIAKAKSYLFEVHFKDKQRQGTSVMLGDGAVDFPRVLQEIKDCGCMRIFESYFGRNAAADTKKNMEYIRRIERHDQERAVCGIGKCRTASPAESEEVAWH